MDTICPMGETDTSLEIFGENFRYPFFAGPVGAVNLHYSDAYDDMTYNDALVRGCAENGIAAFTGDGANPAVMAAASAAIRNAGGRGIPTVKPWSGAVLEDKLRLIRESDSFAVAMDVDAAGLPFLKNMEPPAGMKSVEELTQIIARTDRPFIVKGIMTVKGALKAKAAGAAGIVVSNHGGRVLDQCPATAEVLSEIADAVVSFEANCARGILPNNERIAENLGRSLMLVTALNPHIGYENAARIAETAHREGITLKEAAVKTGLLSEAEFDRFVQPEKMVGPKREV